MIKKSIPYKKIAKKHGVKSTSNGRGVVKCKKCKLKYFVTFHDLEQRNYKRCPNGCDD